MCPHGNAVVTCDDVSRPRATDLGPQEDEEGGQLRGRCFSNHAVQKAFACVKTEILAGYELLQSLRDGRAEGCSGSGDPQRGCLQGEHPIANL